MTPRIPHMRRVSNLVENLGLPCQDLAEAAGVPLIQIEKFDGWHRCMGNGMIIPNVGVAIAAVMSSLKPLPALQAHRLFPNHGSHGFQIEYMHVCIYVCM